MAKKRQTFERAARKRKAARQARTAEKAKQKTQDAKPRGKPRRKAE